MIRRAPGLKLVVQTLLYSLKPIGNTVLIAAIFFIVFGILGIQVYSLAHCFILTLYLQLVFNLYRILHIYISMVKRCDFVFHMHSQLGIREIFLQPVRTKLS